MKVGDLVRKKQGKRVGVITGIDGWTDWIGIYWLDNGRYNTHQKHSLEVISESR